MKRINGRYDLQEPIGSGGMGVVYKAYDAVLRGPVALKTIRDTPSPMALELFRKECSVLASISHPNIVKISDIGEFEDGGAKKPYFVMPLLPGDTLDKANLSIDHICDVIVQTCRGLQAAHDRGLIHRDLKPSNIFVLPDHTAVIIDFGIAHMTDSRVSMTIQAGTLPYMSPEQLDRDVGPASDLFSLGVIFYEAVTRRHPFRFPTEEQTAKAIRFYTPPPAWELNNDVNQTVSRIIHKCMAKQPYNRFPNARELADTIQKAQRNQPISMFDSSHLQPRISRAAKAFEEGNAEFAAEIITKLEAEGHADPAISNLRKEIDDKLHQKRIGQLIDSARKCFEAEEYALAQQKLDQVLRMDPSNMAALMLQASVQNRVSEQKVDDWLRLARQHLDNNAFSHAREALQNLLQVRPKEATAVQLLAEADRREQKFKKVREEKSRLYQAAVDARKNGEMSAALTKMERLIALDGEVPDTTDPERSVELQKLYEKVRAEHDAAQTAIKEARRCLSENNFAAALAICDDNLKRFPGHATFQALKIDVQDTQRQELSAKIAETDRRLEAEPDLDRRIVILKEATKEYPEETHFERALRLTRDKRDLVSTIVSKAQSYEENGQFNEALERWETLRTIHHQYPGLDFQIERLKKRRDQQSRTDAKARWVNHIDALLESGMNERALSLLNNADAEFPEDEELASLRSMALQAIERNGKAAELLADGHKFCQAGEVERGLECLRQAHELDERNPAIRGAYIDALLKEAAAQLELNSDATEDLSKRVLQIDPAHPLARSLNLQALDRKREVFVNKAITETRRLQAEGDMMGALARVEQALESYPQHPRLLQLHAAIRKSMPEVASRAATASDQGVDPGRWPELEPRSGSRNAVVEPAVDLDELERIFAVAENDPDSLSALKERTEHYLVLYPDDERFRVFHTKVSGAATRLFEHKPPPPQPPPEPVPPTPSKEPAIVVVLRKLAAVRDWAAGLRDWAVNLNEQTRKLILIVGGAAVALIAVVWIAVKVLSMPIGIDIRTVPNDARVSVDGGPSVSQTHLRLNQGPHRVQVIRTGYVPYETTITVSRANKVFDFKLNKLPDLVSTAAPPAALQISTDLALGRVTIDQGAAAELQDGQFTVPELAAGQHVIDISSKNSSGQVLVETGPDGFSKIRSVQGRNLAVVAISSLKGDVSIHANSEPLPAWVDETAVEGKLGTAPLSAKDVAEGNRKLRFGTGTRERTVNFTSGTSPVLLISAISDRDAGLLIVHAGTPDATVFIDGREQKKKTNASGEFRLPNLSAGDHIVKVTKEDFETREGTVSIKKGIPTPFDAILTPLPTTATLTISNAVEGARVLLDDEELGVIGAGGTFTTDRIQRGAHTVRLRHDDYETASEQYEYKARETHAWRAVMRQIRFTVSVKGTPEGASVQYVAEGKSVELKNGQKLRAGTYTATISAAGYKTATSRFDVGPDKPNQLTFSLSAEAAIVPTPNLLQEWAKSLKKDNGWYVVPPGDAAWSPRTPGTVEFAVAIPGNKAASWYVDYRDGNDYVKYELFKDKLRRTVVHNKRKNKDKGDKRDDESIPDELRSKQENANTIYRIRIKIGVHELEHQVFVDGAWKTLDKWAPGRNLTAGKFGFLPETRLSQLVVE